MVACRAPPLPDQITMISRRAAVLGAISTTLLRKRAFASEGQTFALFGDSMAEWNDVGSSAAETSGTTVIGCAIGGTAMSFQPDRDYDAFSMSSLSDALISKNWSWQDAAEQSLLKQQDDNRYQLEQMKRIDLAKINVAVIWFGTNDFILNCPLGTATDTTRRTFNGAINHVTTNLRRGFPALKLLFVAPVFRSRFVVGDNRNSLEYANDIGIKLIDYADAIIAARARHGFATLDLYRESGIGPLNSEAFLLDGVHLSERGQHLVGPMIGRKIKAVLAP